MDGSIAPFLTPWYVRFEQDRTDDPRFAKRMQMLSGGGLVLYGLTMTFASTIAWR